ncbi:MAG: vitamin K epoxide reductase family protein [Armatimonadetes bacterium]|nr:vitamin K epoxide reductase family protein [Armatimonadota bacterium]
MKSQAIDDAVAKPAPWHVKASGIGMESGRMFGLGLLLAFLFLCVFRLGIDWGYIDSRCSDPSCLVAERSAYADGVILPLSFWGALASGALLTSLVLGKRKLFRFLMLGTMFGAGLNLIVLNYVLRVHCPFCLFANGSALVAGALLLAWPDSQIRASISTFLLSSGIGVLVAVGFVRTIFEPLKVVTYDQATLRRLESYAGISISDGDYVWFGSTECPACKAALKHVREHPISFVPKFVPFVLNMTDADEVGKGSRLLLQTEPGKRFEEYKALSVDKEDGEKTISGEDLAERLRDIRLLCHKLGIDGVPAIYFVRGNQLVPKSYFDLR